GRFEDCVEIARQQTRDGAHLLDVCVDYVGRDGCADMTEVAGRLATAATLPLVIDSTEPDVVMAGLEMLGGRAVVTSVNYEAGDDRGHPRCQAPLPRRADHAGGLERVVRPEPGRAGGAELGLPRRVRAGRAGLGDRSRVADHADRPDRRGTAPDRARPDLRPP